MTNLSAEGAPVVIDTDIGDTNDDAIAVLFALAGPVRVVGASAVAGNFSVGESAGTLCDLLGRAGRSDIPVGAGPEGPRRHVRDDFAEAAWGDWRLGARPSHLPSAIELVDGVLQSEPWIDVLALGPLTNVADMVEAFPGRVRRVIAMGGAFCNLPRGAGNQTPTAEFNIWVDPHAFRRVLDSQVELHLVPLNATRALPMTVNRARALVGWGGELARLVEQHVLPSLEGPNDVAKATYVEYGLADLAVVVYAAQPRLFRTAQLHVDVDLGEGLGHGSTVAYTVGDPERVLVTRPERVWTGVVMPEPPPGARRPDRTTTVVLDVDTGAFEAYLDGVARQR